VAKPSARHQTSMILKGYFITFIINIVNSLMSEHNFTKCNVLVSKNFYVAIAGFETREDRQMLPRSQQGHPV
jgi:hypothetical protein